MSTNARRDLLISSAKKVPIQLDRWTLLDGYIDRYVEASDGATLLSKILENDGRRFDANERLGFPRLSRFRARLN